MSQNQNRINKWKTNSRPKQQLQQSFEQPPASVDHNLPYHGDEHQLHLHRDKKNIVASRLASILNQHKDRDPNTSRMSIQTQPGVDERARGRFEPYQSVNYPLQDRNSNRISTSFRRPIHKPPTPHKNRNGNSANKTYVNILPSEILGIDKPVDIGRQYESAYNETPTTQKIITDHPQRIIGENSSTGSEKGMRRVMSYGSTPNFIPKYPSQSYHPNTQNEYMLTEQSSRFPRAPPTVVRTRTPAHSSRRVYRRMSVDQGSYRSNRSHVPRSGTHNSRSHTPMKRYTMKIDSLNTPKTYRSGQKVTIQQQRFTGSNNTTPLVNRDQSLVIEHPDIPIPEDITVPIKYEKTPQKHEQSFNQSSPVLVKNVSLLPAQYSTVDNNKHQNSFIYNSQQYHNSTINSQLSTMVIHSKRFQNLKSSNVIASKVTNHGGLASKITEHPITENADSSLPPYQQKTNSSALIATETFHSLTESKIHSDNNRYKKLWIKKIEEIAELKRQNTEHLDKIVEKDADINKFKGLFEETSSELKSFQLEKMKKSKLLIENKLNGEKYKQLYDDSKEQIKLLQEERTNLMDMLKSKDKVKFDEVSNINNMYTEARKECDRLQETNQNLTTDSVKLRTALATIEQRLEDLQKEYEMYKVNIESANKAMLFAKESELQEVRERVITLEKENDKWREKEEALRNDLFFLKEVNMKSHEITRTENDKRIAELNLQYQKELNDLKLAKEADKVKLNDFENLKKMNSQLETEVEMLKLANKGFQQRTEHAENEMKNMKDDNSRMKESYLNMQIGDENLKQEAEKILFENETLKEEVLKLKNIHVEKQNSLDTKNQTIENLSKQVKDNLDKIKKIVMEKDSLAKEKSTIQESVAFMEKELADQKMKISQQESQKYDKLNQRHKSLQKDQEELMDNFNKLKEAHDHLIEKFESAKMKNESNQMSKLDLHTPKGDKSLMAKQSSLVEECSRLEDEKDELMKMVKRMRKEIKANQNNIDRIMIRKEKESEVDASPRVDYNKSQTEGSREDKILKANESLRKQLEYYKNKHENKESSKSIGEGSSQNYPHIVNMKDKNSLMFWDSYKRNYSQNKSQDEKHKSSQVDSKHQEKMRESHHYNYDVRPFVNIGEEAPVQQQEYQTQNIIPEDSFDQYYKQQQTTSDQQVPRDNTPLNTRSNTQGDSHLMNKSALGAITEKGDAMMKSALGGITEKGHDMMKSVLGGHNKQSKGSKRSKASKGSKGDYTFPVMISSSNNSRSRGNRSNQQSGDLGFDSNSMQYELEPARHVILEDSLEDYDPDAENIDGMGNPHRFKTVVPNLVETQRNTINTGGNLNNNQNMQNEQMQQLLEMITALQTENENLKNNPQDSCPVFPFANVENGESVQNNNNNFDPNTKPNTPQLGGQFKFEDTSSNPTGTFAMDSMMESAGGNNGNELLGESQAQKLQKMHSKDFDEVNNFLVRHSQGSSGNNQNHLQVQSKRNSTGKRSNGVVTFMNSQGGDKECLIDPLNPFSKKGSKQSFSNSQNQSDVFGNDEEEALNKKKNKYRKRKQSLPVQLTANKLGMKFASKKNLNSSNPPGFNTFKNDEIDFGKKQNDAVVNDLISHNKRRQSVYVEQIRNTINPNLLTIQEKQRQNNQPDQQMIQNENNFTNDSFMQNYVQNSFAAPVEVESSHKLDSSKLEYQMSSPSLKPSYPSNLSHKEGGLNDSEIAKIMLDTNKLKKTLEEKESLYQQTLGSQKESYETRTKSMENTIDDLQKKMKMMEEENKKLLDQVQIRESEINDDKQSYINKVNQLQHQIEDLQNTQDGGEIDIEESNFLRFRVNQLQEEKDKVAYEFETYKKNIQRNKQRVASRLKGLDNLRDNFKNNLMNAITEDQLIQSHY